MFARDEIIPEPPLIRRRLAQSLRETRLLRRLLRLSVEAANDPQNDPVPPSHVAPTRPTATTKGGI
jgi:hypothetical protein